jgi:hypothetical protein
LVTGDRTRSGRQRVGRARPTAARRLGLSVLLGAVLVARAARAGDIEFSAAVDRTTLGLGETLELTLTVQGEDMLSAPSPTLPPLADWGVLGSSSSQSTNISLINGQLKKQVTLNFLYELTARHLGKSTIPACQLTYQGKAYASQPIEITVVKAAQGQAAPAAPGLGAPSPRNTVPLEGNLVLSVVPSKRTVYVGEPVTVEVSLGTRLQLSNAGWAQMPAFDGFWTENLYDADRFQFQRKVVDGRAYDVSLLKKAVLFPLAPGKATIKPMAFNVAVTQPSRDLFDMFGTTQTVRVESKPVPIEVLPLPEAGKPKEFTGGVGRFTLSAALDRAATTNSEPVSLTVKLSGSGNIRMIDKPLIPPVDGLRVLAPEVKDDAHASGDGVSGSKTFRFPVIPQGDGKYVIPAIAVATFDPGTRAYRTLTAGPFEFTASGSATTAPLAEPTGLKVLGTDLNYIKPDAAALAVMPIAPPWWPNLLYGLSLAMFAGAFWYRGHSQRLVSDRGYARKSRSTTLARQRLRQAERLLRQQDERGLYAALTQAVMGYLGDRFNIETHAMTKDQLRAALEECRVAPELSATVLEIVDECELARFSPALLEQRDPRRLFERTREVLGRI